MMVERLKQQGTSHSSRDLLKICVNMGAVGQHRLLDRQGKYHLVLKLS